MMQTKETIVISDLSHLPRVGLKGPQAADWLIGKQIKVPEKPNACRTSGEGTLVLRLGLSEFLIEGQTDQLTTNKVKTSLMEKAPGIYPVPRADTALRISGSDTLRLFSEICMLDLSPESVINEVYMTQVAGISAILTKHANDDFRIWCDCTYSKYLQTTLSDIAKSFSPMNVT